MFFKTKVFFSLQLFVYLVFFCLPFLFYCIHLGLEGINPTIEELIEKYKIVLLWVGIGA